MPQRLIKYISCKTVRFISTRSYRLSPFLPAAAIMSARPSGPGKNCKKSASIEKGRYLRRITPFFVLKRFERNIPLPSGFVFWILSAGTPQYLPGDILFIRLSPRFLKTAGLLPGNFAETEIIFCPVFSFFCLLWRPKRSLRRPESKTILLRLCLTYIFSYKIHSNLSSYSKSSGSAKTKTSSG